MFMKTNSMIEEHMEMNDVEMGEEIEIKFGILNMYTFY